MTDNTQPALFTERMRAASREIHSVSNGLVNAKLLVAFTNESRYGSALSLFYYVFKAMEEHMDALKTDPAFQPLAELLPMVRQTPAFVTDLTYLLGPDWRDKCSAPVAVQAYLDHLQALRDESPYLLLAHCYTQQSAMLAGGQIIRRLARQTMKLPEGKGTSIFEYQMLPKKLAREWADAVNTAADTLSPEQQEAVLKEHCRVFAFNNSIISNFQVSWADWGQTALALVPRAIVVGGGIVTCGVALWLGARMWNGSGPTYTGWHAA